MKLYKLHDAWILKRQIVKFGALPRDDLRMQKCRKSDISFDWEKDPFTKFMYQNKCLDSLHASLTDNLSLQMVQTDQTRKSWLSFNSKLFDILMVLDGTLSLDWPQSWKNDTTEKIRVSWRYKTGPSQETLIDQKNHNLFLWTYFITEDNPLLGKLSHKL